MCRRPRHDYQPDHRGFHDRPPEHMDTQAFAEAYGGPPRDAERYYPITHSRTYPPEEAYYGSQRSYHNNDNFLPNSHNAQISNLFKTLERHKAFLKSDPLFEKNIHDQIDAIAKSRIAHDAHIKDLDERLAQYSALVSRKNFRPNAQVPPGMRDLGAKRTASGLLVFFKTRPLGFEVNFRATPMRVTRVWRPDLAFLGVTAGMSIEKFDGYRPTKDAIENAEPPFIVHFGNAPAGSSASSKPSIAGSMKSSILGSVKSSIAESVKSVSTAHSSPVENSESPEDDVKIKKQVKTADVIRTITTPDREEPENSEINTETVPLHPKLDLEKFTTRELGKLYGRAYGQYLEQQVLPWSKETDTAKERLKILMGRIRVLLEKYSVVLEKEIQQKREGTIDSEKLEMSLQQQGKVEEVEREREETKSVGDVEEITTENSEKEAVSSDNTITDDKKEEMI